eukprot:3164206-Prymnesium_polylepis.1
MSVSGGAVVGRSCARLLEILEISGGPSLKMVPGTFLSVLEIRATSEGYTMLLTAVTPGL